jgi:3-methylcrotonyl-CoA carboxylase alpha subunit
VTRTAAAHGIRTTTVYTEPDALSEHAHASPYSINLGPADAYLDGEKIIRIAKGEGCDAVHPGYGFVRLSWTWQYGGRVLTTVVE